VVKKNPDLHYIEESFTDIKSKSNVDSALATLERTLKRMYALDIHVSLVNNNTNKFFGMVIYPSKSLMDNMIDVILNGKQDSSNLNATLELWKKNKEWYLEIDSLLLYDTTLNANPSEITAVLLHEIGHIINSNSVPQRLNRIIRYQVLKLNYSIRELCKKSATNKLFELAVIEACSNKNFRYINKDSERAADNFVVNAGYGDTLDNFITKLIYANGNSLVNRDDSDVDKDIEIVVKWAVENIGELEVRKTKLKQSIDVQIMKTPSMFVKSILKSIKDLFINTEGTAYKQMLQEQILFKTHKRIVAESMANFFNSTGKIKKLSQLDLDVLSVQIDKIENTDDKIYLLDLIYEKLELVNMAIDMIDKGSSNKVSQSRQSLAAMQVQLQKMRDQVLGIKIKDKQYGLFIKYPEGYEG
jgi:hypothetical protein